MLPREAQEPAAAASRIRRARADLTSIRDADLLVELRPLNSQVERTVIPAPASTVVFVRSIAATRAAREVLMLRRPATTTFAPGAWVFPGGRLDGEDYGFDHARLTLGPTPAVWAHTLETGAREAAAYPVAALREAWEETGILLAHGGMPDDLVDERTALLSGDRTLGEVLGERGLRLATDRLRYIGRWITPPGFTRRYDTRFFVAAVAPDVECTLIGAELAEARWTRPGDALQASARGEMPMLPPTLDTLHRLHGGQL